MNSVTEHIRSLVDLADEPRERQGANPEGYRTISVPRRGGVGRKFLAFLGPGYLVAVGYMDPGNWATSIAAGSKVGYALLMVVVASSLMAIVLQSLCTRLSVATGLDLARSCRASFRPNLSRLFWVMAEIAVVATDVAEVLGTAIGLKLLFGLPLWIGALFTILDVFLVLQLQRYNFRYLEIFVITLIAVVSACFGVEFLFVHPSWNEIVQGMAPRAEIFTNPEIIFLAIGIIGATIMPHNLYLHSYIVQTRDYGHTLPEKREAIKLSTIDCSIALAFAMLINVAILVLAAATFNTHGQSSVVGLDQAYQLLASFSGGTLVQRLFGLALVCCGINSSVTGTLAGQAVMEGFLNLRMRPWMRRLCTRSIAILPVLVAVSFLGENSTTMLMIVSQVVLSLQLPFAAIPLVLFTANAAKMGPLVSPGWLTRLAWVICVVIVVSNAVMIVTTVGA